MRASFLVDLEPYAKKLNVYGDNTMWIHCFPFGEYEHPVFGLIKITPERASRFADNINKNVRGIDLDIDYDHKMDPAKGNKAAGWVRQAAVREDGLWLNVEWTKEAEDSIANREFRYFSPEFSDEWKDASGTVHKDVLFGGGLTNRPFLKDLVPINLSDTFASLTHTTPVGGGSTGSAEGSGTTLTEEKEANMDPTLKAALIKRFGLKEDATDAEVLAAVEAEPTPEPEPTEPEPTEPVIEDEPESVLAGISASELKKLTESNPLVANIVTQLAETQRRLGAQEAATRLAETDNRVTKLSDAGVPKVITDKLRKIMLSSSGTVAQDVYELVNKFAELGTVPLSEEGSTRRTAAGGLQADDVMEVLDSKVNELRSKDTTLSYAEAVDRVMLAEPALYERYINYVPAE